MDAFMFGKVEGCEAYFLSHFHSDHYGGLGAKFDHGPIYCSQVTANLVAHQLRVKPEFINPLPMETRIDIGGVGVTLIDANHCPGAAIFVFDVPNEGQSPSSTLHLHTGDFRADAVIHLRHPLIASIPAFFHTVISAICQLARGVCVQGRSVEDIVSGCWDVEGAKWNEGKGVNGGHIAAAALMRNWIGKGKNEEGVVGAAKTVVQSFVDRFRKKKGTLVVVGTYLIGKEKVFKAIAQCLNTKVFADASKRRILKLLQDPELDALITSNPQEAGVYVIGLGKINRESLTEVLQGAQDRFDKIIGIRPTGWTYRAPKTGNKAFKVTSLKPNAVSSQICVVGVPYSEHSSYEELKMFVTGVGVDKVIPTVNVAKHEEMGKLFGRWKNGEE
ncbi:DNA repair metallo-beta-lactamase-domain-containing protein [Chytridium lagenaria]|nr:DNA repair metallo-beta-lactamase-domain-containing protein [Chytridium lagenaria]